MTNAHRVRRRPQSLNLESSGASTTHFVKSAFISLAAMAIALCASATEKPLPKIGDPHNVNRVEMGLSLPEFLTGIPASPASKKSHDFRWTFMTFHGGQFALWINDTLIYHNEVARPRWIPHNRTFHSVRLKPGRYRLRVREMKSGKEPTHTFDAGETGEIIIYSKLQKDPLLIRSFPHAVRLL